MLKRALIFGVAVAAGPLLLAVGCSSSQTPSGPASTPDSGGAMTQDSTAPAVDSGGAVDSSIGDAGFISDSPEPDGPDAFICGTKICAAGEQCCKNALSSNCYPKTSLCPGT